MDQNNVISFIRRIVSCGNPAQSALALQQLAAILELQGAHEGKALVMAAFDGLGDLQSLPDAGTLTEADIQIAKRRADERRRREEEASRRGRC